MYIDSAYASWKSGETGATQNRTTAYRLVEADSRSRRSR